MEINENLENTMQEDNEAILPEGWTEGDNIFDEKHWSGASGETSEEDNFFEDEDDVLGEETAAGDTAESEAPTTEPKDTTTPTEPAEGEGEEEEAPTTETETPAQEPTSNKLRFKARVDHEDVEAEIDESDLPTLYQKATATDRYQAKLAKVSPLMDRLERMAKNAGYESAEAMLDYEENYARDTAIDNLVKQGTPREIAEDYVDRRFGAAATPAAEQNATGAGETGDSVNQQQKPAARDFAEEVRELWAMRPDLRGVQIPSEVAAAAANGQNLSLAYFAYEAKQAKASADTLRKENEVYKQNAAAAAKAPVKGVSGGGATDTQPKDPFLIGCDSDW